MEFSGQFEAQGKRLSTMLVTPDHRHVITNHYDPVTIRDFSFHFYEATDPHYLQKRVNDWCSPLRIALTPDGKWLCLIGYDTIRVIDTNTYQCVKIIELECAGGIRSANISSCGTLMYMGVACEPLYVLNIQTGVRVGHKEHVGWTDSIVLSKDDRYVFTCIYDYHVCIWDVKTFTFVECIETPVQSMVCSDHHLYVGTTHGCIEVWDIGTWRCIDILRGHHDSIHALTMSPDQRFLFSGSDDTRIRMWDMVTHECVDMVEGIRGVDGYYMGDIVSLAVSSDGAYLYSGDRESHMFVWTLIRTEMGWGQDCMDLMNVQ